MKKIIFAIIAILIIGVVIGAITNDRAPVTEEITGGDSSASNDVDLGMTRRSFAAGFSSTPATQKQQDILNGFLGPKDAADVILIQDPFNYEDFTSDTIPNSPRIQEAQAKYDLVTKATKLKIFYSMDTITKRTAISSSVGASFADPKIRESFTRGAVYYAKLFKPAYMALGVEINYYYALNRSDYANFVSLYRETYDAVKTASPSTQVFATFQYEAMQGLQKGVGESAGAITPLLDKLDAIAISTYPFYQGTFKSVEDLPENYYTKLSQTYNKPIIIAESGWSADPGIVGGSVSAQSAYLRFLAKSANDLRAPLLVWFSLYDADHASLGAQAGLSSAVGAGFKGIGLLSATGKPKAAYTVWKAIYALKLK